MFLAGSTILIGLVLIAPDMMLELIGKDRTLTGRTDIWDALLRSIKEKPYLGYGYGVYWMDQLGPSYYVRLQLQWGIPTAHNGWIETWLSVGVLGVALFALHFIWTFALAMQRIWRGGSETYFAILVVIVFFIFSVSESAILQQNDLCRRVSVRILETKSLYQGLALSWHGNGCISVYSASSGQDIVERKARIDMRQRASIS